MNPAAFPCSEVMVVAVRGSLRLAAFEAIHILRQGNELASFRTGR
jgi:hypothetical protein